MTPDELDAIEARRSDSELAPVFAALREAWDAYGHMEQRYEQERAWGTEARAEVERLCDDMAHQVRRHGEAIARAEKAEAEVERLREHDHICSAIIQANDDMGAAVARVRALCDDATRSDRSINGYGYVLLRPLRAALDGGDDE